MMDDRCQITDTGKLSFMLESGSHSPVKQVMSLLHHNPINFGHIIMRLVTCKVRTHIYMRATQNDT